MSEIQSLARGLQIIDMVWQAGNSVGITELAEKLGVDKSSASRLVKTLVAAGYLQQERGSRRFVVGTRLYQMGWELVNRMPLREKARKYLYRLVNDTEECAHTAVYSEGKALMIDDVEAAHSLRVVGGIGRLLPMHCTAVGKTLLAFGELPPPQRLERKMPNTITDPAALTEHLARVCELGYAYDDEEHQPGVRCLAAPVYNRTGMAVAAIGISGPTVRVTDHRVAVLAGHVIRAARDLSAELGYEDEDNDGL